MAEELYVSRAAIWKAIRALENDGVRIEAVTNKGYRIITGEEAPNEKLIKGLLTELPSGTGLFVFESIDSTNNEAKRMHISDPGADAVIISGSQTCGRGRRGREFFSPVKTGIYLSILIHPDKGPSEVADLTCMTAVAVCSAVSKMVGIETEIKWVNDIFYKEKKIAGILTEGESSVEDGRFSYVVIGIGLNVYEPYEGFPDFIRKSAGALMESGFESGLRDRLCAEIINCFYKLYLSEDANYIDEYRRRSMLIGRYIKIMNCTESQIRAGHEYAYVCGIDDKCGLAVRYDDGVEETLQSGEVSVIKY